MKKSMITLFALSILITGTINTMGYNYDEGMFEVARELQDKVNLIREEKTNLIEQLNSFKDAFLKERLALIDLVISILKIRYSSEMANSIERKLLHEENSSQYLLSYGKRELQLIKLDLKTLQESGSLDSTVSEKSYFDF